MKKIIAIILVVLLIAALATPAFAVTPTVEYKPVKLPQIKFTIKIPDSVFTDWFKENPIKITYTSTVLG